MFSNEGSDSVHCEGGQATRILKNIGNFSIKNLDVSNLFVKEIFQPIGISLVKVNELEFDKFKAI